MPAANTVTLENLAQKLPQWRPDDQSHLYAVVDMGRLVELAILHAGHAIRIDADYGVLSCQQRHSL